jgi:cellulose synthase/poly-beta-1,6-N-acetylglucosamine synthase-like glycosyltransferase
MDWYYYIAPVLILLQLLFLVQMYNNYRYVLAKYKRKRQWYRPRTVLIVPCKGLDSSFQTNISSFFEQDYENYLLWFVVADESDPAYDELHKLKNRLSQSSKAQDVQVLVAGEGQSCSQKVHNLFHCYKKIGDDVEVMAFADSDICIHSDWLSHIVYPLRQAKSGAASGYRWFVPKKNNPATLVLSAMNARIAQLLGNTRFNQAWGGSMAIRVDVFRRVGLDKIWPKTLSDDLSLSYAVKKAGMKVAFVPACLAASYESTTWPKLFEFSRRQFLIARVSSPGTWWFGLCISLYSAMGLWGGAGLVLYAAATGAKNLLLFAAVPIVFFASQASQAILCQKMISKLLKKDRRQMKAARATDILFFWMWAPLFLFSIISSAFGRTIQWRGIRYKLLGPTNTIVVDN